MQRRSDANRAAITAEPQAVKRGQVVEVANEEKKHIGAGAMGMRRWIGTRRGLRVEGYRGERVKAIVYIVKVKGGVKIAWGGKSSPLTVYI